MNVRSEYPPLAYPAFTQFLNPPLECARLPPHPPRSPFPV